MHPRNGVIVRPLLECRRAQLRAWLNARAATNPEARYLDDETNDDVSIPRNRVRHELLPLLAERFNPAVVDVLAREAALLRDVWAWMDEASASVLADPAALDVATLRALPAALQRLVVWRALDSCAPGRERSFDHVSSVIRLIHGTDVPDGRSVDLPGVRVQRLGSNVVLVSRDDRAPDGSANQFSFVLSIPGRVLIPGTGSVVSAEPFADREKPDHGAMAGNGAVAQIRQDELHGSLVVRNRRPGDRFRPVGLCGSKKIQDLFVDRKVPRSARDEVPIVVDGSGRIVWVAGFGIDERFRVTDPSQAVLVLRLTRAFHGGAPE
jgi:tRNA(Ile)-lysidine synthase